MQVWRYAVGVMCEGAFEPSGIRTRLGFWLIRYFMPTGAKFLDVQVDDVAGEVKVWFLVDPHSPHDHKTFGLAYTGVEVPPGADYLGTFQVEGLAYHLFRLPEPAVG